MSRDVRQELVLQGASVYTGVTKPTGEPNGFGIMCYANNEKYIGMWRDGKRHGQGVYYYEDGAMYDGEWVDECPEGRGICLYPATGNIYYGHWHSGKVSGTGLMFYSDGDSYVGEWKDGKLHGSGNYIYSNGEVYEGQWFEDNIVGDGKTVQALHGCSSSPHRSLVHETTMKHAKLREWQNRHIAFRSRINATCMENGGATLRLLEELESQIGRADSILRRAPVDIDAMSADGPTSTSPHKIPSRSSSPLQYSPPEVPTEPTLNSVPEVRSNGVHSPNVGEVQWPGGRWPASEEESSSDEDLPTTSYSDESDDSDADEARQCAREIFNRIQRQHGGRGLTRATLAQAIQQDEIKEMAETLRHHKTWARILDRDGDGEVTWEQLEHEYEEERGNQEHRHSLGLSSKQLFVSIQRDPSTPLGGATINIVLRALTSNREKGKMLIQTAQLDRQKMVLQRAEDPVARRRPGYQVDDEDDQVVLSGMSDDSLAELEEYDAGGITPRHDLQSPQPTQLDIMQMWSRGSGTKKTSPQPQQREYRPPPAYASVERAKPTDYVMSQCGPGKQVFSLKSFARHGAMMLFPLPFLPCMPWAPSNEDLEREYVVSGSMPRWQDPPGKFLITSALLVPVVIVSCLYKFRMQDDEKEDFVSLSDVLLPVAFFVAFSLASATYQAFPRKKAHLLETLPDYQFDMLASFTYNQLLLDEGKGTSNNLISWVNRPTGKFVLNSRKRWKWRTAGCFLALLVAMSVPIHRQVERDSMWGTVTEDRIITICSACAILIALTGSFSLLLKLTSFQLYLLKQLKALERFTMVAIDPTLALLGQKHREGIEFILTDLGVVETFNPQSITELRTFTGWYVSRSFLLYGSPVLNHYSRNAVLSLFIAIDVIVSIILIATFLYDAIVYGYPKHNDISFTVASMLILIMSPLVSYNIRLWLKVKRHFRRHYHLVASAVSSLRVQAVCCVEQEQISYEASVMESIEHLMVKHDFRPHCLGIEIHGKFFVTYLLFTLLAIATLAYRWFQLLR